MAIEDASPARLREIAAVSDSTEDLRALLIGYAGILEKVDDAPPVLWATVEGPRLLRWLRIPAPRVLVRTLLARHVSRRVETLMRSAERRVAFADDAPGPLRDLTMLEHFEQSLPTALRTRFIAPLALLGVLFVAYVLANWVLAAKASPLLADFTKAAVELDRGAAVEALGRTDLDFWVVSGAAVVIAYSVMLTIVPLLSGFSVKRQLLQRSPELARLEARSFAALGCRRVYDLDLDLVAQLGLVVAVGIVASALVGQEYVLPPAERDPATVWTMGAIMVALTALAGVELLRRYTARRTDATRRYARITRAALWLVLALSVIFFIYGAIS